MDTLNTLKILIPLVRYPWLFSFIENDIAEELQDRDLFSLIDFKVTARGLDFITRNPAIVNELAPAL